MIMLRDPKPDEAVKLTDLCLRSKAVWGYDQQFMEACTRELTFTPTDLLARNIQVADADGRVIGVVELALESGDAELAKLFVEPSHMGTGAGRKLFEWAKATARASGASILTIDADPGAANFYRRMGAVDDGVVQSGSIPGRALPRLALRLKE